jgi:hypothetical protein
MKNVSNFVNFFYKTASAISCFWTKYKEAIFVTSHQYRLRFLHYQQQKKHRQIIASIQVIIKRIEIKLSLRYLASNKFLIKDIHPVDACRIAFISCFENNKTSIEKLPRYIKSHDHSCPIIKQQPLLKIKSQHFDSEKNETVFTIQFVIAPP